MESTPDHDAVPVTDAADVQPSTSTTSTTSTDPQVRGRSRLVPLVVLSLCGFTSVTTELMTSGLLTRIAADLGAGIAQAGALTSVYAIAIVVTVPP